MKNLFILKIHHQSLPVRHYFRHFEEYQYARFCNRRCSCAICRRPCANGGVYWRIRLVGIVALRLGTIGILVALVVWTVVFSVEARDIVVVGTVAVFPSASFPFLVVCGNFAVVVVCCVVGAWVKGADEVGAVHVLLRHPFQHPLDKKVSMSFSDDGKDLIWVDMLKIIDMLVI